MDELLDLVNEDDEVVGEVWKSKANIDPKLIHREVLVYIFDDQKRMLMQQRSFNKKVYPGEWAETCAGHVMKGEKPEVAAVRELNEEMGLKIDLKFIEKRLIELDNETHFAYCFMGKYNGQKVTFDKNEVEAVAWVKWEDFEKYWRPINDEYIQAETKWVKRLWDSI